jgi:hypothetical protein
MFQPALAYHVLSNFLKSGAVPDVLPPRRQATNNRRRW